MEFTRASDRLQVLLPRLGSEAARESVEMAAFLSQNGLVALRKEYGDHRFDRIVARRAKDSAYVVHDSINDIYFKSYELVDHAVMQQKVMNELHRRLVSANIGVSAVRHLSLILPESDTGFPVAVIEPAPGKSLREQYRKYPDRHQIVLDVRRRLNTELGVGARRILINDINRMGNDGGNVFVDESNHFTLIDQPFMGRDLPYYRMKIALKGLQWQNRLRN